MRQLGASREIGGCKLPGAIPVSVQLAANASTAEKNAGPLILHFHEEATPLLTITLGRVCLNNRKLGLNANVIGLAFCNPKLGSLSELLTF